MKPLWLSSSDENRRNLYGNIILVLVTQTSIRYRANEHRNELLKFECEKNTSSIKLRRYLDSEMTRNLCSCSPLVFLSSCRAALFVLLSLSRHSFDLLVVNALLVLNWIINHFNFLFNFSSAAFLLTFTSTQDASNAFWKSFNVMILLLWYFRLSSLSSFRSLSVSGRLWILKIRKMWRADVRHSIFRSRNIFNVICSIKHKNTVSMESAISVPHVIFCRVKWGKIRFIQCVRVMLVSSTFSAFA